MSEDIIDWLNSDEHWDWSRNRVRHDFYAGQAPSPVKDPGPVRAEEDPCGRGPLSAEEIAARERMR